MLFKLIEIRLLPRARGRRLDRRNVVSELSEARRAPARRRPGQGRGSVCLCVCCTLIRRPQQRLPSRVLRAVESAEALRDGVEAQQNRLRLQLPQQRTPSVRKAAVLRLRQCRRLRADATCSSVNSRRFTTHRLALSSATRASLALSQHTRAAPHSHIGTASDGQAGRRWSDTWRAL